MDTQVSLSGLTRLSRPQRWSLAREVVAAVPAARWTNSGISILRYMFVHRRVPRLLNPRRFNDHLLSQKTSGALLEPLRQLVSDKEHVKNYVQAVVGPGFVPTTYAVLRTAQEIDSHKFGEAPSVIKPTHMSGEAIIVHEAHTRLDRTILHGWMRMDHFRWSREENYRYLVPKIIVEEFISRDGRTPPDDFKVLCYRGQPKFIQVDSGRFERHTRNLYDTEWNRLPLCFGFSGREVNDPRPDDLEMMLDLARRLSAHFEVIRVDFYTTGRRTIVGEMTNCPDGAMAAIRPDRADFLLGSLLV